MNDRLARDAVHQPAHTLSPHEHHRQQRRFWRRLFVRAERHMTNDELTRSDKALSQTSEQTRSQASRGDVALVRWIAEGRVPALGAFYDRWAKHVQAIVRRTTRDSDDADRIIDATFWYAWNTSPAFDGSSISVSDWLQKIIRRKSVEQRRLRRLGRERLMSTRPQDIAPGNPDAMNIVKLAIPQADLCDELRRAVSAAAIQDAESMAALRNAVCEYTISLRNEGIQPEGVLIRLKTMIQNRTMPPSRTTPSDWHGTELREQVSAWSIEAFFEA
jgi:DNA-directed RNA polymerase specialized sigma24 family protein